MPAAASEFSRRWARENLARAASEYEIRVLELILASCGRDRHAAAERARRYYRARGAPPHGINAWVWRKPDSEDILSSCQQVYIVPLRTRTAAGRRVTLVRLPAFPDLEKPISIQALVSRWLMILDIRVREETERLLKDNSVCEEVILVDVCDLKPSQFNHHFAGQHWKDFFYCLRSAHPLKFSEVHIVNTHKLKATSLLMLRAGLLPWKRDVTQLHTRAEQIQRVMGADCLPREALPTEYGGEEAPVKDLNDEWTKKLLSNASWLEEEATRLLTTQMRSETPSNKQRRLSEVRIPALRGSGRGTYPVLRRSRSERHICDDSIEEGAHGNYRTFKVSSDHGFYA